MPEDLTCLISSEHPDSFILCPDLDFKMTDEMISAIHSLNIPVIILSAMKEGIISRQLNDNLVTYNFLSKPFDEQELIDCIWGFMYTKCEEENKYIYDYGNFYWGV
ncbi:MAG: hypothetical protein R6W90_13065 [Ignavibacteriaceae bacterium]